MEGAEGVEKGRGERMEKGDWTREVEGRRTRGGTRRAERWGTNLSTLSNLRIVILQIPLYWALLVTIAI